MGRPSRLRRSVGLSLARRALWRALAAVRGDGAEASLAVVISNGGMDLADGSARHPGAQRVP